MKIGKTKEAEGRYRVTIDGQPSPLFILKGEPPKFGMPQRWHCFHDGDVNWALSGGPGLSSVLASLAIYARVFGERAQ